MDLRESDLGVALKRANPDHADTVAMVFEYRETLSKLFSGVSRLFRAWSKSIAARIRACHANA